MQIKRVGYGVKGFGRITSWAVRWATMVSKKAEHKLKIIAFWEKHGLEPTIEAFSVKKRTLYNWKKQLKEGQGKAEALNEKSRRPKSLRKRAWPFEVTQEIRKLREEHPNLGKEKVSFFLQSFCLEKDITCPSISTIGNLIRDMGGLRKFPVKVKHNGTIVKRKPQRKTRKPKDFVATHPGHCGSFDTIVKHVHGSKRYMITFVDIFSRFSLAWATTSHASKAAKEFFDLVTFLFPFPLEFVLTDNGSEFMKHFDEELRKLHKTHWHTYPKTPKMNAHCERFNRTIQEEFMDYHMSDLMDPVSFNAKLMKHLLWHNTERPHWSLKMQTPVKYISNYYPQECKMYLTDTAG
jgi:transposase InsO family protein/transposase-like protein